MRTGKELILATKPYAHDSSARSWAHLISTALLLASALAGTLWNVNLAGRIGCSLVAGLLYLRFFVIYHDQQHQAILPHSVLAEGLMRVFGLLILSPSSVWRSSHNHHHNHNSKLRGSHIGSFPIMTKEQYLQSRKARRFNYLFMRHPLTILFGYVFIFLYGMCLYPALTKTREHFDGLLAFLLHVLLGVAVTWFFGWPALFLTLIFPTSSPVPLAVTCSTPNTISPRCRSATTPAGPTTTQRWNPPVSCAPAPWPPGSRPISAITTFIT